MGGPSVHHVSVTSNQGAHPPSSPHSRLRPQGSRFVVLDSAVAPRRQACGAHAAPYVTRIVGPRGPWVLVTWQCFTKHQINEELTWRMIYDNASTKLTTVDRDVVFGSEFKLMEITKKFWPGIPKSNDSWKSCWDPVGYISCFLVLSLRMVYTYPYIISYGSVSWNQNPEIVG